MKPIRIGRDFGNAVEIASGLQSPPDRLLDGDPVNVAVGAPGEAVAKIATKTGSKSRRFRPGFIESLPSRARKPPSAQPVRV